MEAAVHGGSMQTLAVEFPSGRELLGSWWGFLRDGGLIVGEPLGTVPEELSEGDPVVLEVRVRTLKTAYRLTGRLVRRQPPNGVPARAFVAFDPGQDQDVMLNAAWADTYDVPQRKHRRVVRAGEAVYRVDGGAEARCEVVDVSPFGIRLRAPSAMRVGARLQVRFVDSGLPAHTLEGKVRWSSARGEAGVEFARPALVVQQLLNAPR